MTSPLMQFIRSRSREEWQRLLLERWIEGRAWIQENGELAAVVALFAGILLVLAFKLVLALVALSVIAAFVIWQMALPQDEMPRPTETSSSQEDSK